MRDVLARDPRAWQVKALDQWKAHDRRGIVVGHRNLDEQAWLRRGGPERGDLLRHDESMMRGVRAVC